jgi:HEPN domain-containing protein
MIVHQTLKYLIANRLKDASVLISRRRYPASVYIAGYAIEIALKYKICRSLHFWQGFPETKQEFSSYLPLLKQNNAGSLIQLGDIRHHDLDKLLIYTGVEYRIRKNFESEWEIVSHWSPGDRYRKVRILQKTAGLYYKAAKKIIKEITNFET